jgi:drug/metabolite transporter (DMT)-like permease
MTQQSISTRAWVEMTLLGIIWGASFLSIKVALAEVPVLMLVAHRVFWAALL